MKKLLIVFLLLLSACETKPILIGYGNSLSGSNASLGVEGMYGVQLAIKEINANGGIDGRILELIVKDDKGNSLEAVRVDNEMKDEGVVAIIGHGYSKVASAIVDNANKNDILLISPTISTETLTGIDDNFIRVMPEASSQAYEICSHIIEGSPVGVSIVVEELNKAHTFAVGYTLKDCLEENNISSEVIPFITGENDEYHRVVSKLDENGFNYIVIIAAANDVVNLEQFHFGTNITYHTYLSTWATTTEVLKIRLNHEGEIHGVGYFDFDSNEEEFTKLSNDYLTTYGKQISFSAIISYETTMLLAKALENAESYSTIDIKAALTDRTFDGIMNQITIDEYGDVDRMAYNLILKDEKFIIDE